MIKFGTGGWRAIIADGFYVLQNKTLFLKLLKFLIPKQTRFRTLVLLLQPSIKPLDQGTSIEFNIS